MDRLQKQELPYLLSPDGTDTKVYGPEVKEGAEYIVSYNIVLREGFPSETYYRSRKSIGVIPEGAKVLTLTPPRPYSYHGTQYWIKVRAL